MSDENYQLIPFFSAQREFHDDICLAPRKNFHPPCFSQTSQIINFYQILIGLIFHS